MPICYLGVGANLGNRQQNIKAALRKINLLPGTKIIKTSKVIQTLPQGGPKGQPKFLNAVIKLRTHLSPSNLLIKLKGIELELGRKRTVRWGARVIDLDILLYEDRAINTPRLRIPHPKILERDFVIRPLLEIL